MKIIQKMAQNVKSSKGVTIAFLGDSVTQGCFEIYKKENGKVATVYDQKNAYATFVADILRYLYPSVPVNIINAGISGNRAPAGLKRVQNDVIRHAPDLTVVCYGLNDCKRQDMETYIESLKGIFTELKNADSEILFMTPNMMSTQISVHLTDPDFLAIAEQCTAMQNGGVLEAHLEAAKALCKEMAIPVCDCYAIWKKLSENGVDTTELLSNKINHPTREMNRLFAVELVRTMFSE